ncbi:hypothetical protein AK812_SmicGene39704 [Symbiodinium microadriaticum]|uniref:Uncharacterized protein n=1 Tax=Symbiodinium microadriaticum TaxID=2951 RepID=A0A1Q9CAJ3_SYMMI|nr:hypothetical protein AK812_SmicGene39704 [Symbiodinium microadriaticum]
MDLATALALNRLRAIRSATSRLRGTLHLSAESLAQMLQASLVRGRWQGRMPLHDEDTPVACWLGSQSDLRFARWILFSRPRV